MRLKSVLLPGCCLFAFLSFFPFLMIRVLVFCFLSYSCWCFRLFSLLVRVGAFLFFFFVFFCFFIILFLSFFFAFVCFFLSIFSSYFAWLYLSSLIAGIIASFFLSLPFFSYFVIFSCSHFIAFLRVLSFYGRLASFLPFSHKFLVYFDIHLRIFVFISLFLS